MAETSEDGIKCLRQALRGIGVEASEISDEGGTLHVSFPTDGRDSIRALCDLTRDVAVAMVAAGIAYQSIRVTGLGGTLRVAA